MIEVSIVALLMGAVGFFAIGGFVGSMWCVHHDWCLIGKNVNLGGGRCCNVYECRHCGKIKVE